ncbi:MAG: glycoside hydrolase family protein [Lentisphaeria bacterium]|nr:MAG: glycoside hydrolase family protein [Lentisphaeria bacterium]
MAHNPRVIQYGNRWLLYYIGLSYSGEGEVTKSFADRIYGRIRIGLAEADSPAGPWRSLPEPILNPLPGSWDAAVVTNPAPCVTPDKRIFLYYRSNTPQGLRIGLAVADTPEGPYRRVVDHPVLNFHVEDPFVWHDGEKFLMIAKDVSGTLCGERIAGAYFESRNGIDWKVGVPPRHIHVRCDMRMGTRRRWAAWNGLLFCSTSGDTRSAFMARSGVAASVSIISRRAGIWLCRSVRKVENG